MNEKVKTFFLPGLLLFAIITRLPLIMEGTIPFMYDHGRDSIQVLDMLVTHTPKLIGPRASIPGLFFGPGWYYLIAPALAIGKFSPLAPVYMMLMIFLVEIYLVNRYFGKTAAVVAATGISWLGMSVSAWNPNIMPLVILLILILIQKMDQQQKGRYWFLLGLFASSAFHFSSAFAITLLISLPIICWRHRYAPGRKAAFLLLLGFAIPFIPQGVFELRHDFIQTKAIVTYFAKPSGEREINLLRPLLELGIQWGRNVFLVIPWLGNKVNQYVAMTVTTVVISTAFRMRKRFRDQFLLDSIILILPAYILFSLTHFSSWYWYGTFPIVSIGLTKLLHLLSTNQRRMYICLLLLSPLLNLIFFFQTEKPQLQRDPNFLPAKLQVVDWIYQQTGGRPFAVYHYLPDVYDYAYQYLWLTQKYKGKSLPVDFSYRKGEAAYIPEKAEILTSFAINNQQQPEYIFYVVEVPFYKNYLQDWWNEQHYSQIINQTEIVPGLLVYQALP